jgi:hypothetical protein
MSGVVTTLTTTGSSQKHSQTAKINDPMWPAYYTTRVRILQISTADRISIRSSTHGPINKIRPVNSV